MKQLQMQCLSCEERCPLIVSLSFISVFASLFRAAMTSIQLLRGDLTSSGDQPSAVLATYFKVGHQKCSMN